MLKLVPPNVRQGCSLYVRCRVRRRSATGGGFSLLEVLIVVVILAIASMIAVPMFSSAATLQLDSAVNMIASDLEYAKSLAISRSQDYTVVFDVPANRYQIEDQSGNVLPHPVKKGFSYVVDLATEGLGKVSLVEVNFGGTSQVKFDCLGSPDNGGTIRLQAAGVERIVTVEPVTGYVTIN